MYLGHKLFSSPDCPDRAAQRHVDLETPNGVAFRRCDAAAILACMGTLRAKLQQVDGEVDS